MALKPWYGTWPPRIRKEKNAMKKSWWETQRVTILMFGVFLVGIIILLISYQLNISHRGDWQLVHDIGIGFIVAGLLGAGIDQILRRQLAEDAFKATIGYLLPDELKGEMQWIYEQSILCIQHIQTSELRPIQDNPDICELYTTIQRTYENISANTEDITLGGGWGGSIFEWFHKGYSSDILSFTYTTNTEDAKSILQKEYGEYGHIGVKEVKVKLAPGVTITTVMKTKEVKHTSDLDSWAFLYPTKNPQVTIKAYEGIKIRVIFGYREKAQKLSEDTFMLKGTLLRGQRLNIQWVRISDEEQWKKNMNAPTIS